MKLALVGYGRMGRVVEEIATGSDHEIVARLGSEDSLDAGALEGAEVVVEFTRPDAVVPNIRALAPTGVPLVVGTTGWYDRMDEVEELVREHDTALLYAPNFSLGVHLFSRLVRELGTLVDGVEDYDLHLHEAHHRHKVDHPSGTARRLADLLVKAVGRKRDWREGPPEGRPDPSTLWVTSVRAGEIPGSHTVAVEGPDDRIELTHEARGRSGFARGAVTAAEWIRGRRGIFTLDDLVADSLRPG